MNQKNYSYISTSIIVLLLILSLYNSTIIGLSWDETFHHINGKLRFEYLVSFGNFEKYNFLNNKYYPGLYDTLLFAVSKLITNIFGINIIVQSSHIVNWFFSILSLIGLYLTIKKVFSKNIAKITVILTFLNPFFFGHMSVNQKDNIIFFSLIWFSYFFIKYIKKFNYKRMRPLLFSVFFLSFGLGVRLSFGIIILPLIISGLVYIFIKNDNNLNCLKKLFIDLIIGLSIVVVILTIFWPQLFNGEIQIYEIIKSTLSWKGGPKLGLINGTFYETSNTPATYFFSFLKNNYPLFLSLLLILSYIIIFTKKISFFLEINNFKKKFVILNSLLIFPIMISIIFNAKIYDGIRLFLFLVPILSTISSLSLIYLFDTIKISNISKTLLLLTSVLFILFITRFVSLNPYQYSYVNYFSHPVFSKSINKFEHDYWATSLKELFENIVIKFNQDELSKMKIGICGINSLSHGYYFKKYLQKNISPDSKATHIIMINRASFNPKFKETCFTKYEGSDIVSVKRLNLILSTFRKIK